MPIYEYERLSDGQIVEEFRPMAEAVPLGDVAEVGGEPCRRILSQHHRSPLKSWEFIGYSMDPAKIEWAPNWHTDEQGNRWPAFRSRKDVQDFCDRNKGRFSYGEGRHRVDAGARGE